MNAVNPVPAAAAAEPSMEEILASIRRIIADDQSLPGHGGSTPSPPHEAAPHPATVAEPPADTMAASPDLPPGHGIVATPQFVAPEGPAGVRDTPHPLAPQAPEVAGTDSVGADAPEAAHYEVLVDEPDLHEAALRAMHDEPSLRLHERAVEEPPMRAHDSPAHDGPARDAPAGAGGLFSAATSQSLAAAFNTLAVSRLAEDSDELRKLAQEMLRPMLKSWLDENLPSLVEHIIRDEIDRMSHRGR